MTGGIEDLKEHMSQETEGAHPPYSDNSDGVDNDGVLSLHGG